MVTDYGGWISVADGNLQITPQARMKAGLYSVAVIGTASGGSDTRVITFTVGDAALTRVGSENPDEGLSRPVGGAWNLDFDRYFVDHNGDSFTMTAAVSGGDLAQNINVTVGADGALTGNLPAQLQSDTAYTLTLTATQGTTTLTKTFSLTPNSAPGFTHAAPEAVDETLAAGEQIYDANARSAAANSSDDTGITYAIVDTAGGMTAAQARQYFSIDATVAVSPWPQTGCRTRMTSHQRRCAARCGSPFRRRMPPAAPFDGETSTQTVELTINNVFDENPTVTPPTGLTAREGQFPDRSPRRPFGIMTQAGWRRD